MQILPTQPSALLGFIPTELIATAQHAVANINFSDLLALHPLDPVDQALAASNAANKAQSQLQVAEEARKATEAASQAASTTAAQASAPQPLAAASSSAVSKPGEAPGLEAMSNVKMSQEDFAQVRGKLEEAGVPKEKLDEMQKQVASPQGYTWGQFVQGLQETIRESLMPKVELSSMDKANLSSLFGRLGFDAKQSSELAEGMANGQSAKVWKQVSAKLATMDPNSKVTIPTEEAQAFLKALRLPASVQDRLTTAFGQLAGKEISSGVLGEALKGVKAEVDAQFGQIGDALKQLREIVSPVIAQAQGRELTAKKAAESLAGSKSQAATLAKDPVQAVSTIMETSSAHKDQAVQTDLKAQADQKNQIGQPGAHAVDPNGKNTQRDHGAFQNSGKNGQEQQSRQDKAWNEFFGKVRVEGDATPHTGVQTPNAAFATLGGKTVPTLAAAQGEAAAARTQSQQVFSQVESGLLRNLGQGTKQMTLELTPDNLGKLNVVLTVNGKEVNALIKTDNPETSKLLGDSLAQLKDSLERQGLTVAKLEVQTGLAQDSSLGQQWSGANQHNMAQERRDALERMRGTSLLGGISGLAQDMQNTGAQVKNSQGGVDLIA